MNPTFVHYSSTVTELMWSSIFNNLLLLFFLFCNNTKWKVSLLILVSTNLRLSWPDKIVTIGITFWIQICVLQVTVHFWTDVLVFHCLNSNWNNTSTNSAEYIHAGQISGLPPANMPFSVFVTLGHFKNDWCCQFKSQCKNTGFT